MRVHTLLSPQFIEETTRRVRRKRHFIMDMLDDETYYRTIEYDDLNKGRESPLLEHLCREFFLSFFQQAGSCLLSGARPAAIALEPAGFTAVPHEVGWEIWQTSGDMSHFPYWRVGSQFPLYDLLVKVDLGTQASEMETLLHRTWDPVVVSNPQAGFKVESTFDFVKRTTARSSTAVWLVYGLGEMLDPSMMIVGAGPTVAAWYGTALRVAKISDMYYGFGAPWS